MELIIHEIVEKISSSYEKEFKKLIVEKRDISEFILGTKKTLDEIGVTLVAEALETIDEAYRNSKDRKQNWTVKSKDDKKTLTTIFGEVKYNRTYYENKKTGEYSYLSDEAVGISAHDKLDASLKTRLIEEAVFMPYSRSGEKAAEAVNLTSQTVMNSIRELGSIENDAVGIKQEKKTVKILYIEADEDHVALQDGGHIEPKLIYVHEGRKKVGKDRWKLLNVRYFSGVYNNSDELWVEVADYIDQAYDIDSIEKIYLSGDGASWIKNGLSWIKGSIYVMDRYHLSKYVTQATVHMDYTTPIMWNYINNGDQKNIKELFKIIINTTETETKKKSVQEARRYILSNWQGIRNQYDVDYAGCSAEGHVSHILSSRLSSRPLGWCKTGIDQMARLRVFVANGGGIYDLFIERKKAAINEAKAIEVDQKIVERRKLSASHETIGNVTILNIGKRSLASQFLKSVRGA
ncbi:MAG: ISLre2 family transposase [Methanosarcina sp.]|nr:ISLre2 family transposase [Methanosarcina sp.]